MVKNHANFPVYVDSPLAIEATRIFNENKDSCFDEEAMQFVNKGINPISFDGLTLATTSDESRAINFDSVPKIIISASGMCEPDVSSIISNIISGSPKIRCFSWAIRH